MRILLVDDSSTMRRIQKNTLEKIGATDIEEAENGAEAIRKLGSGGKFDLVLLDWNMPVQTGIETLKIIKANPDWKSIPVIMVTSESEKTRILEAIQVGAVEYVVKPFQADILSKKIAAILPTANRHI